MARRANLKLGLVVSMRGRPETAHCVPHGGSVLPRNDTFFMFLIYISGAGN